VYASNTDDKNQDTKYLNPEFNKDFSVLNCENFYAIAFDLWSSMHTTRSIRTPAFKVYVL
jgi:hypothetical protein